VIGFLCISLAFIPKWRLLMVRYAAFVAFMVAALLSLSCASSGSSTSNDDLYMFPEDMLVFHYKSPPRCPYQQVARLTYDASQTDAYSVEDQQARRERRERRKAEARRTFDESGADAVLEGYRPAGIAADYFFIRFTEEDCRE
jgi:hypothetical protein